MSETRQYDLVLLGSTGFTGKYAAEHITTSMPTNIKWAISGRSESKLQSLIQHLQKLNPNRPPPDKIVTSFSPEELLSIASRTRAIANSVGPYHKYSSPVIAACAQHGTHYTDVTGETPWVDEMISKHETQAEKTGAIIMPEVALESLPSDMLAYTGAKFIRERYNTQTIDMISTLYKIRAGGFSAGTLSTALGMMDHYSLSAMKRTMGNPFVLSKLHRPPHTSSLEVPGPNPTPTTYKRTLFQKLSGVWSYPHLGLMTTHIGAVPNVAYVHRTSSMNPSLFSPRFTYEEYFSISSLLKGVLWHFAILLLSGILAIPFLRHSILKLTYTEGAGPSEKSSRNNFWEYRAVAVADPQHAGPNKKALVTMKYRGAIYPMSGILMAETAMLIVKHEDEIRKNYGMGFLTPSCIGEPLVERMKEIDFDIHVQEI